LLDSWSRQSFILAGKYLQKTAFLKAKLNARKVLHFEILIAVPFIFAHGPIDLILVMYEKVEEIKIV
jgi:hypothetical protein